ncbi:MAG: hypothetical protein ABSH21_02730 [Verrucomicrobiia bacterium]|jgi:hypothetical protein
MRIITLALLVLICHVPANAATDDVPFRYEILTDKDSYRVGEYVMVILRLTNTSTNKVTVAQLHAPGAGVGVVKSDGQADELWTFAVVRDGESVRYAGPFKDFPPSWATVEPGKSVESRFNFNNYYDIKKAGKYILKAAHTSQPTPSDGASWSGLVKATDKGIKITD